MAHRQAFQDIDQVGMARPVAKWAAEVPAAGQIPRYLSQAYAVANAGRKGCVHLTIPVGSSSPAEGTELWGSSRRYATHLHRRARTVEPSHRAAAFWRLVR